MSGCEQFLWGFFGSLAVDIVAVNSAFDFNPSRAALEDSGIFGNWKVWVARLLLACLAGGVVVAHDIQTPSLALLVGSIAPLIIRTFRNQDA